MAGDWWLWAEGSVFEAFGFTLGALWSSLEVFWWIFGTLCAHLVHIGRHWVTLGSWVVTFGGFRLHFGRPWQLLGLILRSLGTILSASGT